MSEPFLGQISIVGFNFPPRGWAFCDGQILPINQNQALYSLLGTTYGGDGRTTFGLPDLRGRTPIHPDNAGINQGSKGGDETHTLSPSEMPAHSHQLMASRGGADSSRPANALLAESDQAVYRAGNNMVSLHSSSVGNASFGGNQPHDNMQPYLVLHYTIALTGIFPSRN